MNAVLWATLGILGGFGLTAVGDMVSEEVRDRLDHLPQAILQLAARRLSRAPAAAPAQLASDAGRLARKAKTGAAEPGEVVQTAADLTLGPLAAAPSGLCGRPGKAARSRASVQPPPPCQIRRSVSAALARRRRLPLT